MPNSNNCLLTTTNSVAEQYVIHPKALPLGDQVLPWKSLHNCEHLFHNQGRGKHNGYPSNSVIEEGLASALPRVVNMEAILQLHNVGVAWDEIRTDNGGDSMSIQKSPLGEGLARNSHLKKHRTLVCISCPIWSVHMKQASVCL